MRVVLLPLLLLLALASTACPTVRCTDDDTCPSGLTCVEGVCDAPDEGEGEAEDGEGEGTGEGEGETGEGEGETGEGEGEGEPICGDGVPEGDEPCDDGNDDPDDACNACTLFSCDDGHWFLDGEACDPSVLATNCTGACVYESDARCITRTDAGAQNSVAVQSPRVSASGELVAFVSAEPPTRYGVPMTGLAGTNAFYRAVVGFNRRTRSYERLDLGTDALVPNNQVSFFDFSAELERFVFVSGASNLAPNGSGQVYLRERSTGETRMVSFDEHGAVPGVVVTEPHITALAMSADGRTVVIHTLMSLLDEDDNLVCPEENSCTGADVYAIDVDDGTIARAPRADSDPNGADVSGDGRTVVFSAQHNGTMHVLRWSRDEQDALDVLSRSSGGTLANGPCFGASISDDGRLISFLSNASNLDAEDVNGSGRDAFVRDLATEQTELVSRLPNGAPIPPSDNYSTDTVVLSGDGTRAAVQATFRRPEDDAAVREILLVDLATGAVTLGSAVPAGVRDEGAFGARSPALSARGTSLVFLDDESDQCTPDVNGIDDVVFAHFPLEPL